MTSFSRRTPAAALAILALVATAGCSRVRDHRGYVFDKSLVATVQPGVDNKDSVEKTLGRPTFVAEFDPNTWYYLGRDTRQLLFAPPAPTDQLLLTVQFDPAGNVRAVTRRGKETVASIAPQGGKTPTLGRKSGLLNDIFGNIGQVGSMGGGARDPGTADNPR